MIGRLHRFHGHNSLRFVYQHGKTVRGQLVSMKYVPNDRRKSYRCAVGVSKKVSKSAVRRNRIRRRIYEQVRQASPSFAGPYDIVITVYNEQLTTLPSDQLASQIKTMLQSAHITPKQPNLPKFQL